MKKLLVLSFALALVAASACYAAEEARTEEEIIPYAWQAYVFVTGDAARYQPSFLEDRMDLVEDKAAYDGLAFPHYYGYIMVTKEGFSFVKKSPLPFVYLTSYFAQVRDNGAVPHNTRSIGGRVLNNPLRYDELFFESMLKDPFYVLPGVFWAHFNGPPDENYEPAFSETCVFSTAEEKYCEDHDFSIRPPELLLLPTANECRLRSRFKNQEGYNFIWEWFNDETRQWEFLQDDEAGRSFDIRVRPPLPDDQFCW